MKKTIVLIMDGVLAAILIAFVVVAVVNINNNAKNEKELEELHMAQLEKEAALQQSIAEDLNSIEQEENWNVDTEGTTETTSGAENETDTEPDVTENGEVTSTESGTAESVETTDGSEQNGDTTQNSEQAGNLEKFTLQSCMIADSDSKEYTKEELEEKLKDRKLKDVKIALYEMYARYGCRFENLGDDGNDFQAYFDSVTGYNARGYKYNNDDDISTIEAEFSDTEKHNAELLKKMVEDYEKQ